MRDRNRHLNSPAGHASRLTFLIAACLIVLLPCASRAELPDTIERIKPSVVGVGTVQKTRAPPAELRGTGFVVGDGLHIVTNAHVVSDPPNSKKAEFHAIFIGSGYDPEIRQATKVVVDEQHDLALLVMTGTPLPALEIGNSALVREGETYAFTGFPIGAVLGLYPATHTGTIAAKTPIAEPMNNSRQLKAESIDFLRSPYTIFQLDATAFPGNSGSPMYDPATGRVFGVLNKVFVQKIKESALTNPSGISYAIPSEFVLDLLLQAGRAAE